MKQTIDTEKKVIGIVSDKCFMCGEPKTNKHHVIPKELKPKQNVTIPLCNEHKNIMHHIIKQYYFPKKLRNKLSKAKKHSEDTIAIINSIKKNSKFYNSKLSKAKKHSQDTLVIINSIKQNLQFHSPKSSNVKVDE